MTKYLFPLLLLMGTLSYGQVNPPIETIVEKFFARYEVPPYSSLTLRFESRPDGYYVKVLTIGTQEVENRAQFYDRRSDRYLALKFFADKSENPKDLSARPTPEGRQTAGSCVRSSR